MCICICFCVLDFTLIGTVASTVSGCESKNNKKAKNYASATGTLLFQLLRKVQKCYQHFYCNTKNARFFSKHFCDDEFCMIEKLLQLPKIKWKLKGEALPSLYLVKSPNTPGSG